MLSISSPFTVITFDEAVVDMVLADMTKITILSSLFFPLNVFRFCKVLQGPEGTHKVWMKNNFICFSSASVPRPSLLWGA